MNDTVPLRMRAACLRTLGLRLGALLTATIALTAIGFASLPSLAAARTTRRPTAARRRSAQLRRLSSGQALVVRRSRDHRRSQRSRPHRCTDSHVRIGRATRRETERAVVCLLNVQRRRHGLPALHLSPRLDGSAQFWTNTMVRDHAFTHGSDFGSRISAVGFDWSQAGENIADGYSTPAAAVKAWMASYGHCQNILDPDFREVGIGFDRGSALGGSYRPGTWTTDFGLLMNQRPLSANFGPAEHCPY